jgi:hypothetical protein
MWPDVSVNSDGDMIIIKVKERNMCTSEANSKSRKFQKNSVRCSVSRKFFGLHVFPF